VHIPLVLYLAWASTLLPVLAGLRGGWGSSASRAAILVWSFVLVSANALALLLASRGINNHWLIYLSTPINGAAVIVAMIGWQMGEGGRLILRILLPLYLAAWTTIVFTIEDINTFSLVAGPFSALVLLIAVSATFVLRSTRSLDPLIRQDWFWVSIGLLIFYGVETGYPPVALLLGQSRPDLLLAALQARSVIIIVAMITVSWGLLCPTTLPQSGGSSSRLASPSLSSLSRSG
jgi:hypothetical protein